MTIYIGADHGGFNLKEYLKAALANEAYTVVDCGAAMVVPDDDYPDYALIVAKKVSADPMQNRGILICRSGFGMDITANKVDGVRSALAMSPDHAYQARHDSDANVLALAADFLDEPTALKIVKVFLGTPFAKEEKYARRLEKVRAIEINH